VIAATQMFAVRESRWHLLSVTASDHVGCIGWPSQPTPSSAQPTINCAWSLRHASTGSRWTQTFFTRLRIWTRVARSSGNSKSH